MSKSMILVQATWNESQTFKMIPIEESCPYVECIYDPTSDVFVVISKQKRISLQMLPKLDDYGQPITGAKGTRQERHKVEVFQEYYIEKQDAMLDIVKLFAVNSDTFDYKTFMKKEKDK
jgi:hypothetical protein